MTALIIAITVAANRGGKDSVILSEEKYYSSTRVSPELYPKLHLFFSTLAEARSKRRATVHGHYKLCKCVIIV